MPIHKLPSVISFKIARFRTGFPCRFIAVLLLFLYLLTNNFGKDLHAGETMPVLPASFKNLTREINSLKIPADLGKIEEIFQGQSQHSVVILQDAHAVPDAQRNIWKLIEYFENQYGVREIAVEGAASKLDAQFFKSFPDKKLLQKTFEDYLEKGELTGANAAALFSEANFYGIEDWHVYQEGLGFYLKSLENESVSLRKLEKLESKLGAKKRRIY